jgi:chemotaxis signal transduction protein
VRGVTPVHGRLLPRVDLAALLGHRQPDEGPPPTLVVVHGAGRTVAFEVEDVDLAMQDDVVPLPAAWEGPHAVGAARHGDELVPLLEVGVLLARLDTPAGTG